MTENQNGQGKNSGTVTARYEHEIVYEEDEYDIDMPIDLLTIVMDSEHMDYADPPSPSHHLIHTTSFLVPPSSYSLY